MRILNFAEESFIKGSKSNALSPIHVAVMLGNLRLVQRFAIVLNALNQTVDVANRQGMVSSSLPSANFCGFCWFRKDGNCWMITPG